MPLPSAATEQSPVTRGALLRERAYEELKALILNGQLAKTPFLSQRKLASQLGVSLTPVRSAVERLEVEGLLVIGPQQGIRVRELTPDEIADHFEIREALESLVVRKLARRLTAAQTAELNANLIQHEASLQTGDTQQYIALDGHFHLLLAEFSGNADVERVLQQLRDRIFQVVMRVVQHVPERMRESLDEHRRILQTLQDGDPERASAAMTQHLRGGIKALFPGHQNGDRDFRF